MFQFLCRIYEHKDLQGADDEPMITDGAVIDNAHRNGFIIIHKTKSLEGSRQASYSVTGKGVFVIERQRRRASWLAREA